MCASSCSCSELRVCWCLAGPPEQNIEEEWQKLQEHPDVLASAPDDEVLAELLAVQVSLGLALLTGSMPFVLGFAKLIQSQC